MWRGCCVLISRSGGEKTAGLGGRRSHLELKRGLHLEPNGVGLLIVERRRQGDDEWKCDEQKAQHDLEALGFGVLKSQDVVCVGRRAGGWRAMSRATSIAGVRPLGWLARLRALRSSLVWACPAQLLGGWLGRCGAGANHGAGQGARDEHARQRSGARPRAVQTATFARARTCDSGEAARPRALSNGMTLLLGILVNFVGGIYFHAAGTVFELHNKGHVPDIIEIDAVDTLHEVESTSSLTCTGAP